MARMLTIAGVSLEIEERGEGPPLLFLHAGEGLAAGAAVARSAGG